MVHDDSDLSVPLVVVTPVKPHASSAQLSIRTSQSGSGSTKTSPHTSGSDCSTQVSAAPNAAAACNAGNRAVQGLLVAIACLCWLGCSSSAILINRHILIDLNFPFPCTVAAVGMVSTAVISRMAARLMGTNRQDTSTKGHAQLSWSFYCSHVVPLGMYMALSLLLGNAAYMYLSVAFIQMLKALTPVVTMLWAFQFRMERPSLLLMTAVGLSTAGVAAASWGEGAASITGVTIMCGSVVCEALRLVLTQVLVSARDLHPMQTLSQLAPAAAVWMVIIAGVVEALHMHQTQGLYDILQHPWVLLASAAASFGSNAMAVLVVTLCGALTLKCLAVVEHTGLVCFGVVMLGEQVSGLQAVGFAISLVGLLLYTTAKVRGDTARSSGQQQAGSSNSSKTASRVPLLHRLARTSGRMKAGGDGFSTAAPTGCASPGGSCGPSVVMQSHSTAAVHAPAGSYAAGHTGSVGVRAPASAGHRPSSPHVAVVVDAGTSPSSPAAPSRYHPAVIPLAALDGPTGPSPVQSSGSERAVVPHTPRTGEAPPGRAASGTASTTQRAPTTAQLPHTPRGHKL